MLLGTTALVAVPAAPAHAQSVWDGSASSGWDTPANWDTNAVPTGADNVVIDDVSANAPVAGDGVNAEAAGITLGATGAGSLTVEGTGTLTVGDMYIGDAGSGSVLVQDGGSISGNAYVSLGDGATGVGEAVVTGAGSSWFSLNGYSIGYRGTGSFTVSNGGSVQGEAFVGDNDGAGTVLITGMGSSWATGPGGEFSVGGVGTGDLTVADGATLTSAIGTLGWNVFGSGTALITGAGSDWTNTGNMFIGLDGEGAVTVADDATISSSFTYLGTSATGTGSALVTGSGSTWMSNGYYIGHEGSGTFTVSGGGYALGNAWIGSDTTGSGTVLITGAGSHWVSLGDFSVGSAGTGDFTIADGGLAESGNALVGSGAGSVGTALVSDAGSVWAVTDLTIGVDGDGSLTLAEGGAAEIWSGTVLLAQGAGSVGVLNIGDGGGAGSLVANWLEFGAGTGSLNFNHDEDDYEFASGIVGAGAIDHLAGVTALTGNGVSFTGTGTVSGGLLYVNGLFGGLWDVLSGGTLGGSGSLGDVSVTAGGILAPGNSIGTLSIANDITFDAGSFFDVEVDAAGNGDLLLVGNTATINGGTVRVLPAAGNYAASTQYTILTANAVAGAFDDVTSTFAFLTPSLSYDAQNVFLTLDVTAAFQDISLTPNQFNTAGAVENLGAGNTIFDEILVMTEEEARSAFDALSGEAHAGAQNGLFHSAQQIREALLARLRALSGGGTQTATAGYAPAAGDALPGGGQAVWGQLFGTTGETDGDGNAAALDRSSFGFLGGIDKPVGEASRLGVAFGYSRSDLDVDARASSGESDNFHLAAYAGTKLGSVDLSGLAAYSYGRTETERTVIVGGLTDRLSADYDTHTFQAAAEAGVDLNAGLLTLTPFAGLAVIHVATDGFTETGGPSALTVASESNTTGVSTLGLRARHEAGSFALSGSAAWRRAFGDTDPASRAAFASAPASPFTVRGAPLSENALALDAAIGAKLGEGTMLTLGYAGELGSDARDHGLRAELRIGF